MNRSTLGVVLTLLFVILESAQFVFFGGLFQKISPFLFGFLVFGITSVLFIGWTMITKPQQVSKALTNPGLLIAINFGAVVTFTAYLISVQLLEPAITYTISAGTMPITAYALHWFGVREGEAMRNRFETSGNILIFLGIIFLAFITVTGLSGFVRGDWPVAVLGVSLAVLDGLFFTLILVYSQRLDKAGVGAAAIIGLRLPFYILLTGSLVLYKGDHHYTLATSELLLFVLIGFLLTIPPLYLLQRAVSMVSTLTLSAITALGPFIIFGLQLIEGRIDYSLPTLTGLAIYCTGAVLSSFGAVIAATGTDNKPIS